MMKDISNLLIKIIGVYSIVVVTIISTFILVNAEPTDKAIIKMALGLIIIWVILLGSLMYKFRDHIKNFIQKIPLNWKLKFLIFATILALLEEIITTSMTNLAPIFGSEIGIAYITATNNYAHQLTH